MSYGPPSTIVNIRYNDARSFMRAARRARKITARQQRVRRFKQFLQQRQGGRKRP